MLCWREHKKSEQESISNGYELDKGLTHLTVYRPCLFSFLHSSILRICLASRDTPVKWPIFRHALQLHVLFAFALIITMYFILFHFICPFIRFYMNCFDFTFCRLSSSLHCFALLCCVKCVIHSALDCSFLHPSSFHSIPFHFLFIVLFGILTILGFCFISLRFFSVLFALLPFSLHYLLFWLCHFWYVCCVRNMHPFIVSIWTCIALIRGRACWKCLCQWQPSQTIQQYHKLFAYSICTQQMYKHKQTSTHAMHCVQ